MVSGLPLFVDRDCPFLLLLRPSQDHGESRFAAVNGIAHPGDSLKHETAAFWLE